VIAHRSFLAMGTTVSVKVAGTDDRQCGDCFRELRRRVVEFGRDGWAWGDGVLAGINRELAHGSVVEIPDAMQSLFTRAWAIRNASGGLFEPRMATLVRLWGFDDPARLRDAPSEPAEIAAAVTALRAAPDYAGGIYGPAPGIGWDFGAIGKGHIVDVALDLLRERGFDDAMIDAGGHVGARGSKGGMPWRVGIRDPRSDADAPRIVAALDVRDESVVTHGDDQRFFDLDGLRYAHILDPANGMPVTGLRSLTVVHGDGTLADAGGAALFVAGRERWPALARSLGIDQVLAIDADGAAWATGPLADRLQVPSDVRIRVAD
jgi:thiamine biosynthesis lipoprotein